MVQIHMSVDAVKILEFFRRVETKIQWFETIHTRQSCLYHYDSATNDFLSGCNPANDEAFDERDYNQLLQFYKNSPISELIEDLKQQGFNICRLRWIVLKPRSCYSIHKDPCTRIHIPLKTSEDSLMIFPESSHIVHLQPGNIYEVDTTHYHTALNASNEERLHLIGCLYPQ